MSIARKVAPAPERPMSIGGLAERLGVPRQRVYNLIKRGQIRAVPVSGALVIQPEEVARVLDAAVRVDTRMGNRLVFDFV
jgi:excisionase family DNA binding protein